MWVNFIYGSRDLHNVATLCALCMYANLGTQAYLSVHNVNIDFLFFGPGHLCARGSMELELKVKDALIAGCTVERSTTNTGECQQGGQECVNECPDVSKPSLPSLLFSSDKF